MLRKGLCVACPLPRCASASGGWLHTQARQREGCPQSAGSHSPDGEPLPVDSDAEAVNNGGGCTAGREGGRAEWRQHSDQTRLETTRAPTGPTANWWAVPQGLAAPWPGEGRRTSHLEHDSRLLQPREVQQASVNPVCSSRGGGHAARVHAGQAGCLRTERKEAPNVRHSKMQTLHTCSARPAKMHTLHTCSARPAAAASSLTRDHGNAGLRTRVAWAWACTGIGGGVV